MSVFAKVERVWGHDPELVWRGWMGSKKVWWALAKVAEDESTHDEGKQEKNYEGPLNII